MAKRLNFEAIMKKEFRWPKEGDEPFVVSGKSEDNAEIVQDMSRRLGYMIEGYKNAGDILVNASSNINERDSLIFPILFNYRQFLELSLKYHLEQFGPQVNIEPNWTTHDLVRLWKDFLLMLERYGTEDPDKADPVVGQIVLEFAKIDPNSYSFRYPKDRNGNKIPTPKSQLGLRNLAGVMGAVENYFDGCDGYLQALNQAGS